jgi:DNA repair exonuclease SbcCD nuclease subunit
MKLLVIGDTHLDNKIEGYLEAQHRALIRIVTDNKPDVVVFLGDIFHHRSPEPEVLIAFKGIISDISKDVSKVYIVRGNHDSANKSDDLVTVLSIFEQDNIVLALDYLKAETYNCNSDIIFIPHFEDEINTIQCLGMTKEDDIVFGHFGYEGCIETGQYFNFKVKKEHLRGNVILGHIHRYSKDGNVTILGTPWSTSFGECDYPHYVGMLECTDGVWSDLKPIELTFGVRHMAVPIDALESVAEKLQDPNYFTLLRVFVDKFTDKSPNDIRKQIKDKYNLGYVDIRFNPVLDRKLSNRISNYSPTTEINSIGGDVIEKYLEENATSIPTELLRKGLEEIKAYESNEDNSK